MLYNINIENNGKEKSEMFNTTNNISRNMVSTHINAVSGNICKTYMESFFVRFHLKSRMAEQLLSDDPKYYCGGYNSYKVVVVQMVVCGDMEVLCELIKKEDYEKYFKGDR